MTEPLWEMKTIWFNPPKTYDTLTLVYPYNGWKDFIYCKPYTMWIPYVMTSWAWRDNMLQIVFATPYTNGMAIQYAQMPVTHEDEPAIRAWILKHMPSFWKV
jgi:hypothetical protein